MSVESKTKGIHNARTHKFVPKTASAMSQEQSNTFYTKTRL